MGTLYCYCQNCEEEVHGGPSLSDAILGYINCPHCGDEARTLDRYDRLGYLEVLDKIDLDKLAEHPDFKLQEEDDDET